MPCATGVSSGTGQAARTPASGSRIMPLKKPEAAPLGWPGRTLTVISRTLRPRDEALARVVGHQLLADEFLDAVAGLRRGQGVVVDDLRAAAARASCRRRRANWRTPAPARCPSVRRRSSRALVAAKLLRMPRSKSASHSPLTAAARWKTASTRPRRSRRCGRRRAAALRSPVDGDAAWSAARSAGAAARSTRVMRSMGRAAAPARRELAVLREACVRGGRPGNRRRR